MRLLFLTFYFRPDLSAGSFRATSLVGELAASPGPIESIEVLSTMPNRYSTFREAAEPLEADGIVRIDRFAVRGHASGLVDQVMTFASYALPALRAARSRRFDAVFATSSRLFTAFLGAVVARTRRVPLYLDIRDIFVESIGPLLPRWIRWAALPVLEAIESFTIRSAAKVNLVSEGFRGYFESKYPQTRFSYFTNGIDDEFLEQPAATQSPVAPQSLPASESPVAADHVGRRPTILYAGNIGEGQGLHQILPELARRTADRYDFVVVGDGGTRTQLAAAAQGLTNLKLVPPVKRTELRAMYGQAAVLFLHLNDMPAFRRVLPSKLFEYAATGKPVLAGVAGHAAGFVEREIRNAAVFAPCDVDGAMAALARLRLEPTDRRDFIDRFARKRVAREMSRDIIESLAPGRGPAA
jgi:glycosyltransferase involved in cell wall biosynthesis